MRHIPSRPIETNVDTEVDVEQMRATARATTEAPWYVEARPRRVDVRGLPENTSYDYRGDAIATTGDSEFGAMSAEDAAFLVMARNNWDRLMDAWDFAVAAGYDTTTHSPTPHGEALRSGEVGK